MQLYVFVSTFTIFVFKAAGALFVYAASEGELWSWPHGKDLKKRKKGKPWDLITWGLWGGGKGKKKYLALVRNGGLNHLLKIFNDISVFLV